MIEAIAYLNGSIALVCDFDSNPLATCVELQWLSVLRSDERTRPALVSILFLLERRKIVLRRHGEIATIQSFAEISFIAADGLIDGDQMCARGERAFDLELGEGGQDARIDVSTA